MTKHKILIVEPDDDIRNMLHSYLSDEGYEVISFAVEDDVMEVARNNIPDIFILVSADVFSGLNYTLYKNIKASELFINKPIIFLVDNDNVHITNTAPFFPVFIEKPFTPKTLALTLKGNLIIYEEYKNRFK